MISHKHRFIYIGIPKCGTTTLKNYFLKEAAALDINLHKRSVPIWLDKSGRVSLNSLYPDCFVFSFVRNPFDRFVSFFLHGFRVVRVIRKDWFLVFNCNKGDPIPEGEYVPPPYNSLEECAEQKRQGLWELGGNQQIGRHKYTYEQLQFERTHSELQAYYLLDMLPPLTGKSGYLEGSSCSFIGRLESFERDFSSLLSILDLPHSSPEWRNIGKEREEGQRRHYSTYYTKRARRLVEEIHAKDLDLLGYEFEDKTRTSILMPLYEKARLQKMREKEALSHKPVGLRLFLLRLYFLSKKTIHNIGLRLIRKNLVLNSIYKNLYKPLSSWMTGKPLVREKGLFSRQSLDPRAG